MSKTTIMSMSLFSSWGPSLFLLDINNLSLVSNFEVTLYANYIHVVIFDKNISLCK